MANEEVKIVLTARDKTKQAFGSVRSGLGKVKSAVFSVKGALVSLGAGAAISKMASEIDNLGKTSRKLGIAAEELQGLRYAAQLSGVETNTLDMAMQRFTRRLAEARNGTGEAKAALEEMNIQLKNNDGTARSQTEVLQDVSDAMSKIKDPADKVRLAFKLFDAEGVSMVNMLDQGAGALKQVTEGFDTMGLALSEENIKKVENANDRFTALFEIMKAIGNAIHVYVVVPLQNFVTYTIARFIDGINLMIKGVQFLGQAFDDEFSLQSQIDSLDAMSKSLRGVAVETEKVVETVNNGISVEPPVGKAIKATIEPVKEATNALLDYSKTAGYTEENMMAMKMNGIQAMEDGFVGLINSTKSVKEAFSDMANSIINDLIRMAIQQSITGPLAGMLGLSGQTGAVTTPVAPIPQFRALGGSVKAGQAYTVGEHGRETFIPSTDGQIVPNGGEGGVTINQTIQISTGVSQTVRAEIANLMPQITNATKAAVADARQRGGGFSKSLVGA